ncbi:MAG: hypothetical protein HY900_29800 [Deltaproteobacteria bacterium]|nr:hypothetical protein [Deltaproteobacteria bacterium]
MALRFGLAEKALDTLRELAEGDEDYFYLELLDPQLLPVRPSVEHTLSALSDAASRSAEAALSAAEGECEALRVWFAGEAPELTANVSALGAFRRQFEGRAYGALRNVAARAAGLVFSCRSLKEKRLRQAAQEIAQRQTLWRHFEGVWKAYPYKRFSRNYLQALEAAAGDLRRARELIGSGAVASYRELRELLASLQERLAALGPLTEELRWMARTVGFGKRVARRLLLLEAVLVPLWLAGMWAAEWALSQDALAPLLRGFAAQHWARAGGLTLCSVVAPLLAFVAPAPAGEAGERK